jgi:short-subunit dehydrogenase
MNDTLLIAGGTDGIGLALLDLVKHDYRQIYVLGRNFAKLPDDANIRRLACDILDTAALERAIASVPEPIDAFVNTIGTFHKAFAQEDSPTDVAEHFALNAVANIALTNLVLPRLRPDFSRIVVCSTYLALESEKTYSLQAATKAAYKAYLDAIRKEREGRTKVMVFFPKSFQTDIFAKTGDARDVSRYPTAREMADVMRYLLDTPKHVYIREIAAEHFGLE